MRLISAQEAADKWGITKRRVQTLCATNRIKNAERVGNMWVLPADAKKPEDARIKQRVESDDKASAKTARSALKNVCHASIKELISKGFHLREARKAFLAMFSRELYIFLLYKSSVYRFPESDEIDQYFIDFFECELSFDILPETLKRIKTFLSDYSFFCDDILAWSYQYINVLDKSAPYSNTQFFTERYMIHTLIDDIDLSKRGKILDPACGGGNFLVLCFEKMIKEYSSKDLSLTEITELILSKLYGYDIDTLLAKVAYINLKLKVLSEFSKKNQVLSFQQFKNIHPNVYYPVQPTISGALDVNSIQQITANAGDNSACDLYSVFSGADTILTNPPFQTVKGMPDELKNYLKANYPNAKCDMCNAFIEFSSQLVNQNGIVGLVTQNSWMYLDSFADLRYSLLTANKIEKIWELGANAFYDINGEKTNVALLLFSKRIPKENDTIELFSLNHLQPKRLEQILNAKQEHQYSVTVLQKEVVENRFDMVSTSHLKAILKDSRQYKEFAVPMQGTSTGNSKELIGYFWQHHNDKDWIMVSKGGGYERWQGLNHYSVKWGEDGEYIKATKGSAIRNAAYFDDTQLAFSDTGTAGLNVRLLLPNQIFVASGPGIRITKGLPLAHLAFLNSRFASYYIRLLTPKLTIAAGYIAKLPVMESLLFSQELADNAAKILDSKRNRLSKRACNYEFKTIDFTNPFPPVSQTIQKWFREDIEDEWTQLQLEESIEKIIFETFHISEEDKRAMERKIGQKNVFVSENISANVSEISTILKTVLNSNCCLKRTKSKKEELGCDGIIEYLSQTMGCSCQTIYITVVSMEIPDQIIQKYRDMYLHSLIMSILDYNGNRYETLSMDRIKRIRFEMSSDSNMLISWIKNQFNDVHYESFFKKPLYYFDNSSNCILLAEGRI